MTNKIINFFRTTAVPTTWVADSIYLIQSSTDSNIFEFYAVDSAGVPKHTIGKSEIVDLITNAIAAANQLIIVPNIAARDALVLMSAKYVYVEDATGDPTVMSGGATYLYNPTTQTYIKTSEAESLDVVVQWNTIQGRPNSSPAQIDQAVANSHTHANKTQLDKIGEDVAGNLMYGGIYPHITWDQTGW